MSRRLGSILALVCSFAVVPSVARADFGLVPDSFQVKALSAADQPELRAGAHPDRLVASFAFNALNGGADGNVKDVVIDLPRGFVGDPSAVTTCARALFTRGQCPSESQIGVMRATFAGFPQSLPIYNIVPRNGEAAEFGFFALLLPVRLVVSLRADGDYVTQIALSDLVQNIPLTAGEIELWGVPADHQTGTTAPRKPFLTNPTSCDPVAPTTLRVRSWQQPDRWLTATAPTGGPLAGCDSLAFSPTVGLALDTPTADTPSGMSVDLTLPQNDDPDGLASSQMRGVTATLPAGLTLSPAVADGLVACDDEQFGAGTTRAPACPLSSKIGTAELATPLLTESLHGDIYIGRPLPTDRYRLLVTASGSGVTLKLGGTLRPDALTGQLFLVLDELPALPFSEMKLHFKDGPRAPLATPPVCGAGVATASISAYRGGTPAALVAPIEIAGGPGGGPCPTPAPFAPQLVAGSSPAVGGSDSAFAMTVRRADGQQTLDSVTMVLPPGLTARLASVTPCPTMQAAAGSCSPASRVGSTSVEAGAGSSPLGLSGDVYLTGPYHGAPFGLALVLHAQAGPLDFGTVVVRATLRLDPVDAQLTVAAESLPTLLGGVPLRMKTLAIDIDRPGFMLNPTSCAQTRIAATFESTDEATSRATTRYALGGCRALRFAPTVAMAIGSSGETRRDAHPALTITLHQGPGQAALRSARVELPSAVTLDPTAVTAICTPTRARDGRCPEGSVVGSARVRTPLLSTPLTGLVHVVQPRSGTQPELWATLVARGIRLSVRSTTAVPREGPISSTFVGLPDIPLSVFSLTLRGGKHGLLALKTSLCSDGAPRRMVVRSAQRGQNDKRHAARVHVRARASCSR